MSASVLVCRCSEPAAISATALNASRAVDHHKCSFPIIVQLEPGARRPSARPRSVVHQEGASAKVRGRILTGTTTRPGPAALLNGARVQRFGHQWLQAARRFLRAGPRSTYATCPPRSLRSFRTPASGSETSTEYLNTKRVCCPAHGHEAEIVRAHRASCLAACARTLVASRRRR